MIWHIPLSNRGIFRITGEDARHFLQGLLTNDMQKASATNTLYACLLTPQGKFLYDCFVCEHEGGFLLDVGRDSLDGMLQKLQRYKLRSKVVLEDATPAYEVAALIGENVAKEVGLEEKEGATLRRQDNILYMDPRTRALGARAIIAAGSKPLFALGSEEQYEALRIACGVPDSNDLEKEGDFPLQFGFDALRAVDFTKGCYVGQEVTTRTKHRGGIRKRIVTVSATQPLGRGSALTVDGKTIGHLLSCRGVHALAQVSIDAWEQVQGNAMVLCEGQVVVLQAPGYI